MQSGGARDGPRISRDEAVQHQSHNSKVFLPRHVDRQTDSSATAPLSVTASHRCIYVLFIWVVQFSRRTTIQPRLFKPLL